MKKPLVALTIAAAAVPMIIGVTALPRPGDPAAPVHEHVAARYTAVGAAETGADNLVTAVLLNYRALDTFGEVMIIFAALAAVMAVMTPGRPAPGSPGAWPEPAHWIEASPIVAFIIRLTAPFIAIFGAWVIFKGHVAPGGGFQGGVILGALMMLLSVVMGRGASQPLIPVPAMRWLQAAAPIAFAVVAGLGLLLSGFFLGYPAEAERHLARELMMIALELGIGVGGAAIILGVFLELRGD